MSFENIIGNKKIKSEFIDNIKNNTLSHSYLFVGQEGIGTIKLKMIIVARV